MKSPIQWVMTCQNDGFKDGLLPLVCTVVPLETMCSWTRNTKTTVQERVRGWVSEGGTDNSSLTPSTTYC